MTALLSTYPKNPQYNHGTEPIELLVREATEVILYGRFFDDNDNQLNPTKVELKDVGAHVDEKIKVEGFIKDRTWQIQNDGFCVYLWINLRW